MNHIGRKGFQEGRCCFVEFGPVDHSLTAEAFSHWLSAIPLLWLCFHFSHCSFSVFLMAFILYLPQIIAHTFLDRLIHFQDLNTWILMTSKSVQSTCMFPQLQTWISNCLWLSSSIATFILPRINLITLYSSSTLFIPFIINYSFSLYFLLLQMVPQIYFLT